MKLIRKFFLILPVFYLSEIVYAETLGLNVDLVFNLCHHSGESSWCDAVGPKHREILIPLEEQSSGVMHGQWKQIIEHQGVRTRALISVWTIYPDQFFMRAHLMSIKGRVSFEVSAKSEKHLHATALNGTEIEVSPTESLVPVLYIAPPNSLPQ